MRATFNSWDTKYKQPFGATRANTSVKISSSGLYYYFNIKQNDQFYFLERSQDGFGDGEIT
ncbi:hypothetical protein [Lactobacillus delbrueckii]|uniref:hypothetical protein n=1 Tax=Lactobacillus delbrueckii TaxID=1584 RepID=UPI001E31ECAB|nr:hypothetical protein [Lactobacillus delbrueckii]MCD5488761.1 hypothetical protein [Lactobacillus delbrueckii subsp. lactis]MCD5514557.1 hypothetical protein [Lactobacillus delbrueckii subsp. lactis]MCD5539573.1 hypothetical protein [Lactobacillus delbrueckii subsp. lactis]MCD5546982.1 hypothetical protein [Lactobacillus delbrueckii subsp. lactis]MCD5548770.1 hypothetical protein [Lactobacillus delbrueckii subsp. lactis]